MVDGNGDVVFSGERYNLVGSGGSFPPVHSGSLDTSNFETFTGMVELDNGVFSIGDPEAYLDALDDSDLPRVYALRAYPGRVGNHTDHRGG